MRHQALKSRTYVDWLHLLAATVGFSAAVGWHGVESTNKSKAISQAVATTTPSQDSGFYRMETVSCVVLE